MHKFNVVRNFRLDESIDSKIEEVCSYELTPSQYIRRCVKNSLLNDLKQVNSKENTSKCVKS